MISAYLARELDEIIYMHPSKDYAVEKRKHYHLKKSIYDLKQVAVIVAIYIDNLLLFGQLLYNIESMKVFIKVVWYQIMWQNEQVKKTSNSFQIVTNNRN